MNAISKHIVDFFPPGIEAHMEEMFIAALKYYLILIIF